MYRGCLNFKFCFHDAGVTKIRRRTVTSLVATTTSKLAELINADMTLNLDSRDDQSCLYRFRFKRNRTLGEVHQGWHTSKNPTSVIAWKSHCNFETSSQNWYSVSFSIWLFFSKLSTDGVIYRRNLVSETLFYQIFSTNLYSSSTSGLIQSLQTCIVYSFLIYHASTQMLCRFFVPLDSIFGFIDGTNVYYEFSVGKPLE